MLSVKTERFLFTLSFCGKLSSIFIIQQASSLVLAACLHSCCKCNCNKRNLKSLTSNNNILLLHRSFWAEGFWSLLQTIARISFSDPQGSAQPWCLTVPVCPELRQKHPGSSAQVKKPWWLKSHPVHESGTWNCFYLCKIFYFSLYPSPSGFWKKYLNSLEFLQKS